MMTTSPSENHSELTLDDWLSKFGRIYGKRHDKHTTEYMISRLVEEVAELVEPMESQDRSKIGPNLADVFSWTCSLAFKLNIDLSSLTWEKYGKDAPHPSGEARSHSLQEFSQPQTLQQWQIFISKLYQRENLLLTPMNALIAMMKDVGDLAMLNRKRAGLNQMTSKLAAILAWTLTVAQLLQLDLATIVYDKYDDHCPICGGAICDTDICHPFKTMYVSFGNSSSDEEKYAILDTATNQGFETLVNPSAMLQNTNDLSMSLDLINKSDAACLLLSSSEHDGTGADYRQIFEALSCHSVLSKGNVVIFVRGNISGFPEFLRTTFSSEKIAVIQYSDANHLRAVFQAFLEDLRRRRSRSEH
jgi:NTP pyrophosphatase (non-canonical NTP hydrolase)